MDKQTQNLLLYAVVGGGAYYLLNKKSRGQPVAINPDRPGQPIMAVNWADGTIADAKGYRVIKLDPKLYGNPTSAMNNPIPPKVLSPQLAGQQVEPPYGIWNRPWADKGFSQTTLDLNGDW